MGRLRYNNPPRDLTNIGRSDSEYGIGFKKRKKRKCDGPNVRPKDDRNTCQERSEEAFLELERLQRTIGAEQMALRRMEITNGDRIEIGLKSSGWSQYMKVLLSELSILRRCQIHGADRVASVWNRKGFKTGAGRVWTPRLVKIAQSLLKEPIRPL